MVCSGIEACILSSDKSECSSVPRLVILPQKLGESGDDLNLVHTIVLLPAALHRGLSESFELIWSILHV